MIAMAYFASPTLNDDADRSQMILLATVLCSQLVITDGDTFERNEERIRVLGLDMPETHFARCDAEYRLGLVAKRQTRGIDRKRQSGDPPKGYRPLRPHSR